MPRPARVCFLIAWLAACDGGLEPRAAPSSCRPGFVGVCGTVRFRGALPDSTDAVYVVAYATFPRSSSELFTYQPQPFPPRLPLGDPAAFYELPLLPGRYEWILAVWKKVGTLNPATAGELLREAGFYRDPADTSRPGAVTVPRGGTVDSVDFVVDFDRMRSISDYFPP